MEASALALEMNNIYIGVVGLGNCASVLISQGKLLQALETCQQGMHRLVELRRQSLPIVGMLNDEMSDIFYEWNDLVAARQNIDKILDFFPFAIFGNLEILALVRLSQIQQAEGDFSGASASLRDALRIAEETDSSLSGYVNAHQARLWLATGQVGAASEWLRASRLTIDDALKESTVAEHLVMARVLAAEGKIDDALHLLDRMQQTHESRRQHGRLIEIGVIQCHVLSAQGDTESSLAVLKRILPVAEAGGYMRIFLDEGAPMNALLRQALQRGITPEYVQKLLEAFVNPAPAVPTPRTPQRIGDGLEALSERELEVLRLMADGASNREIAEKLFVTVGTVKKHLNNIFTKMDVHSRTQALAVAHQQNLI
jgi:LuxR family maltose regulon positive regulatory protein